MSDECANILQRPDDTCKLSQRRKRRKRRRRRRLVANNKMKREIGIRTFLRGIFNDPGDATKGCQVQRS